MDVVDTEEDKWDVNPFEGVIKNGYIYGRGTIDNKNVVMSILEALEYLLVKEFQPKRSFYIAFGHDEEGEGKDGAREMAKVLRSKGVNEFEYLLDEGMTIVGEVIPGVSNLIAIVGVTEKGWVTVNLTAKGPVGHSSMVPSDTSIMTLATAVSKMTSTVHENRFGSGPEWDMFESIAPYSSYPLKLIYSNLWLFSPILSRFLSLSPSTNGLVRTTTAVTIIKGGFKANVLPSSANAIVNHRVHPSQTINDVINYDRKIINDDRVSIAIEGLTIEPHPISPYDNNAFGFQLIKKSVEQVFPDTMVIPGIMIGATDTRWYLNFTRSVYRFAPSILYADDLKRFHGHNERISIDNYVKTINYYHHIILNSNDKFINHKSIRDEL